MNNSITNEKITESNNRDAGRIKAMEEVVDAIINDKDISAEQKDERLKDTALEISNYKMAERLFDFYYNQRNEESLSLYRRYYNALKKTGYLDQYGQYFHTIPLKLFDDNENGVDPELVKAAAFIKAGDTTMDIVSYLDFSSIVQFTHKKAIEYFIEFPEKRELARKLNTVTHKLLEQELDAYYEQRKHVSHKENEGIKPYGGLEGKETISKEVAEEYVTHLEKLVTDLEEQEIFKHEAAPVVLEFLQECNYDDLTSHLFHSLETTNDIEYFGYIQRIFKCLSWVQCAEDELDPYIWFKTYGLTNNAAPVHAEIFKNLVTTELEFNGKKITIEEYLDISTKVHKMNEELVGSLLFNAESRYAVETGTATPTEIFAKKIAMSK
ncbi:hypothetical protein SOX05_08965 [Pseudomonas putida]|nr:hypothetical protein [Pseudomonas putida]MDY4319393.1 hypothetical protein [Pseudomonas putida]MDY4352778.1 hypothetical protein [Pseudomonas putida]